MARQLVTLVVAPHPDDETIGAGIWMHRHRDTSLTVLHVTDGSPRDISYAKSLGFESREDYAAARRRELVTALEQGGLHERQLRSFDYVDQESFLHVGEFVERLAALINELTVDLVFSPAYEGGHPDHDTAAFAVALARRRVVRPFVHKEYRLYHARVETMSDGAMDTGDFLPCPTSAIERLVLSSEEQLRKQRMLSAFKSQQEVIREFPVEDECYRDAPNYDFRRPPHTGMLLYERWRWPITGEVWRQTIAEMR